MVHKTQIQNKVHSFVRKREQPFQLCFNHGALELIVEVNNYNIVPKMKSKYFWNVWKNCVSHSQLWHQVIPAWNFVINSSFTVKYSRQVPLGCAYSMQHMIYQTFAAKLFSQQCLWLSGIKCIFKDKLHVNLKWNHQLTAHFWEYTH